LSSYRVIKHISGQTGVSLYGTIAAVNQQDSEQNEVDGMKKEADSTGKVMHM